MLRESDPQKEEDMESFDPALVTTRPATDENVMEVTQWTKDLGWALVDEGLLMAISKAYDGIVVEYEGVVIGYASTARLTNDLGICPLVMVKEEWRSKGIGKVLVKKAIEAIGNRTVMLHSMENTEGFYKHVDTFQGRGAWHCYVRSITGFCKSAMQPGKLFVKNGDISVEDFAVYEERKVGISERRTIIGEMSKFGNRYAVLCNGSSITGVLLAHIAPLEGKICWNIDILIADDVETAVGLVEFAVKDAQNKCTSMLLCLPDLHDHAKCLIERLKLTQRSSGPTLFNKDVNGSCLNLDCVYAITPLI